MMQFAAESTHERICAWIDKHYAPHSEVKSELVISNTVTANITALGYVADKFDVGEGFHFVDWQNYDCGIIPQVKTYADSRPSLRSGGIVFSFESDEAQFDVLGKSVV